MVMELLQSVRAAASRSEAASCAAALLYLGASVDDRRGRVEGLRMDALERGK
jgi:hypothetical protein